MDPFVAKTIDPASLSLMCVLKGRNAWALLKGAWGRCSAAVLLIVASTCLAAVFVPGRSFPGRAAA